jgi:hypothetical protein
MSERVKQISVFGCNIKTNKLRFYVDLDEVDTVAKRLCSEKQLAVFRTAREANDYAERAAKRYGAEFYPWEERGQLHLAI